MNAIQALRDRIEREYANVELASGTVGGTFGEILCHEIHRGGDGHGLHFVALAEKWRITVSQLGRVIADHCDKLPQRTTQEADVITEEK
jgi:hypothetical protein